MNSSDLVFFINAGSFKAGEEGTILKKYAENEKLCFERLSGDVLERFVPTYRGTVERDGELFLQMSDLLTNFNGPNVMDCKIGVRLVMKQKAFSCVSALKCRFMDYKPI